MSDRREDEENVSTEQETYPDIRPQAENDVEENDPFTPVEEEGDDSDSDSAIDDEQSNSLGRPQSFQIRDDTFNFERMNVSDVMSESSDDGGGTSKTAGSDSSEIEEDEIIAEVQEEGTSYSQAVTAGKPISFAEQPRRRSMPHRPRAASFLAQKLLRRGNSMGRKSSRKAKETMNIDDEFSPSSTMEDVNAEDESSQSFRLQLMLFMIRTKAGYYLDVFQSILSFVSCILYVVGTYEERPDGDLPLDLVVTEYVLTANFIFDYALHLFLAEDRVRHAVSKEAIIDMLAIVPTIATIIIKETSGATRSVSKALRFARIFRIFRILRLYRIRFLLDNRDVIKQKAFTLVFTIFIFMFCTTGIYHGISNLLDHQFNRADEFDPLTCDQSIVQCRECIENSDCTKFEFHTAFYFSVVTLSTVGYGDISPAAVESRLIVLSVIILTLVIIPKNLNSFMIQLARAEESKYKNSRVLKPKKGEPKHLILCGYITYERLDSFLRELRHEEHGTQAKVVILSESDPDEDTQQLLQDVLLEKFVQYIKGSILNLQDLHRARARGAGSFFIFNDPYAPDPIAADTRVLMYARALDRRFEQFKLKAKNRPKVYVQLIRSESRRHKKWAKWDHLLCIEHFKMSLLAHSARCPGFSTLMFNLIRSPQNNVDPSMEEWEYLYRLSAHQSLYQMDLPEALEGKSFSEAAKILHEKFNATILAVHLKDSRGTFREHLNPGPTFFLTGERRVSSVRSMSSVTRHGTIHRSRNSTKLLIIAHRAHVTDEIHRWSMATVAREKVASGQQELRASYSREENNLQSRVSGDRKSTDEDDRERHSTVVDEAAGIEMRTIVTQHKMHREVSPAASRFSHESEEDEGSSSQRQGDHGSRGQPGVHFHADVTGGNNDADGDDDDEEDLAMVARKYMRMQHLRSRRRSIQDAVIEKFSSSDRGLNLRNHIILCGSVAGVADFVHALRSLHFTKTTIPIVVLHNEDIENASLSTVWNEHIAQFDDVYYIQGSPLRAVDLRRAGVDRARAIVFSSDSSHALQKGDFSDSEALFMTMELENTMRLKLDIIVEFIKELSMKYLNQVVPIAFDYSSLGAFRSGQVYIGRIWDALFVKVFFYKYMIYTAELMISGQSYTTQEYESQLIYRPPLQDWDFDKYGGTYGDLFDTLVSEGMLPIALYRLPQVVEKSSFRPFVYTNPKRSETLLLSDHVFLYGSLDTVRKFFPSCKP